VDYQGALDHLDAHVNREATAGRIAGLSLEPIERLLDVLGDPQRAYPVIHLTGTNGKGSVGRMVSALLLAHNLAVGTYASPHLERVNERLLWNLQPIENEPFAELIGDVAELEPLSGVTPSYFELLTAAAFTWFAEVAVDVAVVEVGLLGRWDATNVVDASVAVITNIGRDHTDGVGDWRAAVAAEKAGIIKPGSFLVLGERDPQLRAVFEAEPHRGTWVAGEDLDLVDDLPAVGGRVIAVRTPYGLVDEVFLPLHGRHQAENAVLAIGAVEAFFDRAVDPDVAREAFATVTAPGRFEVVRRAPLVVIDAAHNPPGALAAAETFHEDFTVAGRRTLVVGLLEGRDPALTLGAFDLGAFDLVITCTPPSPRAVPAADLAAVASSLGATVEAVPSVTDAVRRAMAVSTEDDAVLVAGSVYVAGAARAMLAG
jgi:dihydrofolate synthase/folylpolyglutamate synthase